MDKLKQQNKGISDEKINKILALEKEVAFGLWIQVVGQIIELIALSELLQVKEDENTVGEEQILTGVWLRTIGQILEAVSVSKQINETDLLKLSQQQKLAITGDLLVSIGSGYEVFGGVHVLGEETVTPPRIVP
jgi:hypothetical protein